MVLQSPNKIPPFTAHNSAKRVTKYLWQPAAMRRKTPFRPIWLCDTGFHRLCLCLYLYPFTEVMHRILRSFLSADTPGCMHSPLPAQDRNPPDLFSSVYHKCLRITSKYCKNEEEFQSGIVFLCNKSPLIGHKHIQSAAICIQSKTETC